MPKQTLEDRFEKTRLSKEGGSCFECCDYEEIREDMLAFIKAELEANNKEWERRIKGMRRKIQITGDEIDCVDCGKDIINNLCNCEGFNEALDLLQEE